MYYPVNWPRVVRLPDFGTNQTSSTVRHVLCNRDKILLAVLCPDALYILYNKVCFDDSNLEGKALL